MDQGTLLSMIWVHDSLSSSGHPIIILLSTLLIICLHAWEINLGCHNHLHNNISKEGIPLCLHISTSSFAGVGVHTHVQVHTHTHTHTHTHVCRCTPCVTKAFSWYSDIVRSGAYSYTVWLLCVLYLHIISRERHVHCLFLLDNWFTGLWVDR